MITLTCVIIAKNEEKQIADAITSASFCDEIVVIVAIVVVTFLLLKSQRII